MPSTPPQKNILSSFAPRSLGGRVSLRTALLIVLVVAGTLLAGEANAGEPISTGDAQIDAGLSAVAEQSTEARMAAERGYRWLTEKPYLSADFDQEVFDELWRVWPEPLLTAAKEASPEERREMAFSRYGLTPRTEDPTKPLQYVVGEDGGWTMNCFACHGGKVLGETTPGLPNSHYALETLTADVRKTKLRLGRPMTHMDAGSLFVPLGKSNGTTNAVMFGVALMAYRNPDLTVNATRKTPRMTHHDMDAPPWWHFTKKRYLYIDGFAEKGVRPLMQFMLVQENGPDHFERTESDFRDVYAFLDSLEPPKYPFEIDTDLAEQGKAVFTTNCASCHGTYDEVSSYPEKVVPLEELGTDPVRLSALSKHERGLYHRSWFAHFGEHATVLERDGYVAPPLDGIWASAPYFHNGSVPTLWHVLNPSERPVIWQRTEDGYDQTKVGLEVAEFAKLPGHLRRGDQVRTYFNTRQFGKSAAGHDYPDALTDDEKRAVLEYLKTL